LLGVRANKGLTNGTKFAPVREPSKWSILFVSRVKYGTCNL